MKEGLVTVDIIINDKEILSRNLIRFRKVAKLTQAELAEKLNYSDKAISKWERGDGIPDVMVLRQLSDIYNISLDDFFKQETTLHPTNIRKNLHPINKTFISTLSIIFVWFLATCIFTLLKLLPVEISQAWLCFVYAIPCSLIVALIFSSMWAKLWCSATITSFLSWSLGLAFYLTFTIENIWLIFILLIPFQVLIILWYLNRGFKFFKLKNKHKKS